MKLVVDDGVDARHVSLEDPGWAETLGADLGKLRELAADSGSPTYHPDLVAAMARGGVRIEPGVAHEYGYLIVSDAAGVLAAAPTVITGEVLVDLLCGPGLVRAASNAMRRFPRLLAVKTLCVGTAIDQSGGLLVRRGADRQRAMALFDVTVAEVARLAGCGALLWKDIGVGGDIESALRARRYRSFTALPGARLELSGFADLDAYLAWIGGIASYGDLRRKIRNGGYDSRGWRRHLGARAGREIEAGRARSARLRERVGRSGDAPLRWEATDSASAADVAAMYELYQIKEQGARFRWAPLSRRFFERLAAMPEARFSICRDGDRILGFSSALELGDRYVTVRSGVDPELARPLSIPVLLVLRDLETAIERGLSEISLGPTGYALKARFGVSFDPTVAMLRLDSALAPLTGVVCKTVDAANRRAGIHELATMDFRRAFATPEAR